MVRFECALRTLVHVLQSPARFVGLAVMMTLSLALSAFVNLAAIAWMQLQLGWLATEFRFLNPGCSLLGSVSRGLGIGGF